MAEFCVIGRLTRDPEKKSFDGGSSVHIGIAENKITKGKSTTSFWDLTVWGEFGKTCLEQLHKGDGIAAWGEIFNRTVEVRGEKKIYTDINVRRMEFLGKYGGKKFEKKEEDSDRDKEGKAAEVSEDFNDEHMPF